MNKKPKKAQNLNKKLKRPRKIAMETLDVTVVVHKADDLVTTRKSPNQSWSVVMKMEKQKFRTKPIK